MKQWLEMTFEEQAEVRANAAALREQKKQAKVEKAKLAREKMLKHREPMLKKLRKELAGAKLFSLDLEFWEGTSKDVTEVGVATYDTNTGEMKAYHFTPLETLHMRNGKWVPDNKDRFDYGQTEVLPLDTVMNRVVELVSDATHLVGHAFSNDAPFLLQCGYFARQPVLDTQTYAKFYFLNPQPMNLHRVSDGLRLRPRYLHNAGNDAVFTLKSLLKMGA